jgi:hypothetical protein
MSVSYEALFGWVIFWSLLGAVVSKQDPIRGAVYAAMLGPFGILITVLINRGSDTRPPAPVSASAGYCSSCGAVRAQGARFCAGCGAAAS